MKPVATNTVFVLRTFFCINSSVFSKLTFAAPNVLSVLITVRASRNWQSMPSFAIILAMINADIRSPELETKSNVRGVSSRISKMPCRMSCNSARIASVFFSHSVFASPFKRELIVSKCAVLISASISTNDLSPFTALLQQSINLFVIPPNAETTIITCSFWRFSLIIPTAFTMFSAFCTDEPPNFKTFIRICSNITKSNISVVYIKISGNFSFFLVANVAFLFWKTASIIYAERRCITNCVSGIFQLQE